MTRKVKNLIAVIVLLFGLGLISYAYEEVHEEARIEFDSKFNLTKDYEDGIDSDRKDNFRKNEFIIDKYYVALFVLSGICIAIVTAYLIFSNFNKKSFKETFKNGDKVTIFVLTTIILSCTIVYGSMFLSTDMEDIKLLEKVKKTKKEDVDKGQVISKRNINLNDYDTNITIVESGTYTLKGKFEHSILIDSSEEVILNLNNVDIYNDSSASIINLSTNKLVLNLSKNSENVVKDGGSSEYDACIYSNGNLEIRGEGSIFVYGLQDEGEGIATESKDITINGGDITIEAKDDGINAGGDGGQISINGGNLFIKASGDGIDSNKNLIINGGTIYTIGSARGGDSGIDTNVGFVINGGTLISLGMDMLELPLKSSLQNSISFTLTDKIEKETLVTLVDEKGKAIISFISQEDFKTLILSSSNLKYGTYQLLTGGKNTGKLDNYIYTNGKYTKGAEVLIGSKNSFEIKNKITNIK